MAALEDHWGSTDYQMPHETVRLVLQLPMLSVGEFLMADSSLLLWHVLPSAVSEVSGGWGVPGTRSFHVWMRVQMEN